jgi:subtilisin family serine protease
MRRTHLVALVALGLMAAAAVIALPAVGGTGGGKSLSKYDRALLAEARAEGKSSVIIMVAAKGGAARDAASGLEALGATIQYRDDALGYLRASIALDKVEAAAQLSSVEALDVDETIDVPDPRPDNVSALIPQPVPGAGTPRANPYMPTQDTGAAQFVTAHPTWDGRNVTIGIVDTGVSLDHPSLVTTSTGQPKIIDWVTGTDPATDGDPTWLNMATQVNGPTFSAGGSTYTAPSAGAFRFGTFSEAGLGAASEYGLNIGGVGLDRDGNMTDVWGVLWNPSSDTVWVDLDQDLSFADQTGMRNYKVNRDVGYFGTDNPATAIAERVPFVVQTEGNIKYVNIGIVSGAHGSHVAGIAAGNSLFGGSMSGAAPGAKIVSSRACLFTAGCTAHALTEGMIFVAKQSNVDVINMSIGGLPALNDGNNARCVVYKRLIDQSNVQMFISIGNSGPGVNTAGDPGVCDGVLGVGAYITSDTYEKDYGTPMPFPDNLHYFSSRGPREDGGFDPDFVAPGAAISTIPMWQSQGCLAQVCPVGYALFNGTSMAAPQSAGVGALLVSAAKAQSVQKQPDQIRQALRSTARFLDTSRFQAYDQGVGLIDVGAAWNLLKTNIKTVDIASSVAVNTVLSGFLATPGFGQGIYDREGVTLGQAYTRTYTFTRRSGGGPAVTYNASWVGNDGTFSSAGSIALAKGAPTSFAVNVNPSTPGAHSAILRLDDPSTTGIDYQTMNTVIAPYTFAAGNNYSQTVGGTIARGQTLHYFFLVPTGAPAFKVDMTGGGAAVGAGAIRFLRWHPYGVGIDSNAVSNCYNGAPGTCSTGSPTSRTTTNPQAGVWEVTVDARRNSDAFPGAGAPFTLTASILGASVSPNPDVIASATLGVPNARSYTMTNLYGAFTGRAVGTTLGSAYMATPSIANHAQQTYNVTVTPGSTSLRATIGSPSDPAADLDLFVFNCTSGSCVLAGQSADGDSEESVTINNPAAGLWIVLVDGFAVPAGTTTYKYVDVFTNAAFGSVSVTDANALRPAGSSWTVPGSVTANAAPASGRVLLGNVQVRTDTNVLVGSGDVIVQSVTP